MAHGSSSALALSVLLMAALGGPSAARGQSYREGDAVVMRPVGCEMDEMSFNVVRLDAAEGLGEGELLIVVARLGDGEKSSGLRLKRLDSVREWMKINNFLQGRMIFTQGERVRGSGRVEFYIGGKLTHVMLARKNGWFCTMCCNPRPEDFTSYRRRRKKR